MRSDAIAILTNISDFACNSRGNGCARIRVLARAVFIISRASRVARHDGTYILMNLNGLRSILTDIYSVHGDAREPFDNRKHGAVT